MIWSVVIAVLVTVAACSAPPEAPAPKPVASNIAREPERTPPEPDRITGFRDVLWGAPESDLEVSIGALRCTESHGRGSHGDRECQPSKTLWFGEVPIVLARFYFRDGAFVGWWVAYRAREHHPTIRAALQEKYGPPALEKNGGAAWESVSARAYASAAGDEFASVSVTTRAELRKTSEENRARARDASKGF
jgi:hypothetical protein